MFVLLAYNWGFLSTGSEEPSQYVRVALLSGISSLGCVVAIAGQWGKQSSF